MVDVQASLRSRNDPREARCSTGQRRAVDIVVYVHSAWTGLLVLL